MQAFTLPLLQYGATDNLNNTYYTESVALTYAAYVQDVGWQSYVTSSAMAGTLQPKRIEAVKIYGPSYGTSYTLTFNDASPATHARLFIYYRVHVQDIGWGSWVSENQIAGTTGQSKRLEAMQIRAYLVKI